MKMAEKRFLYIQFSSKEISYDFNGAYSKTAAWHGCDCPLRAETVAKTATVAVANPQSMKTDSIEASLEAIEGVILEDKDPIVSPREWYSDFHRFHERLVLRVRISTASFSRGPISGFTGIKNVEDQIDALGPARLSEVMAMLREWRKLILTAYFEQRRGKRAG